MAITTAELLNSIRDLASAEYTARVPLATRTNITDVGNAITSYEANANEFVSALMNKIGKSIVVNKMANNRLKIFKKGLLPFGTDVEEIFVGMAPAQAFDPLKAETELHKRVLPDIKSMYHRQNRQDFYKVTITEAQLKGAFLSQAGMQTLINFIVESLYNGDEYDEYVLMKELIAQYKANFYEITTPEITDEATGKNFIKAVRQASLNMSFTTPTYNKQGVKTKSEASEQVLILHKNVSSIIDVEVLAYAFNDTKVDFNTQVVVVDDFGSMDDTIAVLVDKDWFQVYDTLFEMRKQDNGQGLYWHYFFHHWQVLSTSQYQNAIRFALPAV